MQEKGQRPILGRCAFLLLLKSPRSVALISLRARKQSSKRPSPSFYHLLARCLLLSDLRLDVQVCAIVKAASPKYSPREGIGRVPGFFVLGKMPHLATLSFSEPRSEICECGSLRSQECSEEKVICPKPQRVAVANLRSVDFIKPMRQVRSISPAVIEGADPGCEISEIFVSKSSYGDCGCSPPYFSGSPPSRCGNPMVKDTQFLHPHVYSPMVSASQSKGPTVASIRANPSVRIEGFDCSVRRLECTGRDTGRRVSAVA